MKQKVDSYCCFGKHLLLFLFLAVAGQTGIAQIIALPPCLITHANDDTVRVCQDGSVVFNVLTNDMFNQPAQLSILTPPSHGTIVGMSVMGAWKYEPDPGYHGPDYLEYIVSDTCGSDTGAVFIKVNPLPVANYTYTATGLTVSFTDASLFANGWAWTFGDGTGVLTQNPSHTFPAAGTYQVCLTATNACGSDTECKNVQLPGPCLITNARNDTVETCQGQGVNFNVLNNDSFIPPPQVSILTPPSHGTIILSSLGGAMHYLPNTGFSGRDSMVYQLCDICGCDNATVYFWVNPKPDADFTYQATGLTVQFTDASTHANQLSWSFGDGTTSSQQNPTHTYTSSGIYQVCLTASNACGSDTKCKAVQLPGPCLITHARNDSAKVCQDSTVHFNVLGNDTFLPPPNVTIASGPFHGNIIASSIGGGSFIYAPDAGYSGRDTMRYSLCTICGCDTATVYFFVRPKPVADWSYVATGLSVSFSNASTNAATYLWEFGDGTVSNLENPSHVYGAAGTYTVCLKASNDCGDDTKCRNIQLPGPCLITHANDDQASVCQDSSVTIPVLANDVFTPPAVINIVTFPTNGAVALPGIGSVNGGILYSPNPGFFGEDSLEYELCDICGCDTAKVNIKVQPKPQPSFTYTISGLTVQFHNLSQYATGAFWDFGDGTTSNLKHPSHTFMSTGTYVVCLEATNDCGSATFCDTINIIGPCLITTANDDSVRTCQGQGVNFNVLTNDVFIAPPQVTVLSGPNNGTLIQSTFGGAFFYSPNPGFSGWDGIKYELCDVCGCDTAQVSIYVAPKPVADFTFSVTGFTVDFTDASQHADHWAWHFGDGTGSLQQNPTHTYTHAGFYNVCLTVSNACGSNTYCDTVFVPGPCLPTVARDDSISVCQDACAPNHVTFDVTLNDSFLPPANVQILTFPVNGTLVQASVGGVMSYTPNPGYSGPDVFTYEICDFCGCDTATVYIEVAPVPVAAFTYTIAGLTVDFTDASQHAAEWHWTFGDGTGSTAQNPTHTYTHPGNYHVCLKVKNDCGRDVFCTTIHIPAPCLPPVARNDSARVCEGGSVPIDLLANDTYNPPISVQIITQPVNGTLNFGIVPGLVIYIPNPGFHGTETFTYRICKNNSTGTVANCGCDTASVYVKVFPLPVADWSYTASALTVQFHDSSQYASGWAWSFGDGTGAFGQNPTHTYPAAGNYTVCQLVTNACGTDTACQVISLPGPCLPPVAVDDTFRLCQDGSKAFNVLQNDSYLPPFNLMVIQQPANGQIVAIGTNQQSMIYVPDPGFHGRDSLLYKLCDLCGCDTAKVIFNVRPKPIADFTVSIAALTVDFTDASLYASTWAWDFGDGTGSTLQNPTHVYPGAGTFTACLTVTNDCGSDTYCRTLVLPGPCIPTTAVDDQVTVCQDSTVGFNVLSNDIYLPPATVTILTPPVNGNIIAIGTTSAAMIYKPNPGFFGRDSMQYQVCAVCGCSTGWVHFKVNPQPVADWTATITGFTAHFQDASTHASSWAWSFGDGTGAMTQNPTHSYSAPGVYQVCLYVTNDCGADLKCRNISVPGPCTITNAVNDTTETCEDQAVNFNVLSNDSFIPPANVTILTPPSHGTIAAVSIGAGSFTYVPNPGFTGRDSMTYQLCDVCGCDSATVYFWVHPKPDAFFAYLASGLTVHFNNLSQHALFQVWNFGDGTGSFQQNPTHTYAAVGSYEVCLTAYNACGYDTYCDTVSLPGPCLPPTPENDTVALCQGSTATFNVLLNDTYLPPATINIVSGPSHGNIFQSVNGSFTYAPTNNFSGRDSMVYQLCDLCGCSNATVYFNVKPQPSASFSWISNGLMVYFTNTSQHADSWFWNFGDGNGSFQQHPTHTYSSPGTYNVCLTVFNNCGVSTICQQVTVTVPCGPDSYESNDTKATATSVTPTFVSYAHTFICPAGDVDWFKFHNSPWKRTIIIKMWNLPANYDLHLFDQYGNQVASATQTGTNSETIYMANPPVGQYFLRVTGSNSAWNPTHPYSLLIKLRGNFFGPVITSPFTTQPTGTTNGTGHRSVKPGTGELENEIEAFKVYPNPAQDDVHVEYLSSATGDVMLNLRDMNGKLIVEEELNVLEGQNVLKLNVSSLSHGTYIVELKSGEGIWREKIFVQHE